MWTRLLGLVLVPLAGVGLIAAPSVRDRLDVVEGTRATEQQVVALRELLDLKFALVAEAVPSETSTRARSYGLTLEVASSFMGFDIGERIGTSRAAVDRALAAAARHSSSTVADLRPRLQAMRAALDAETPAASSEQVHTAYADASDALTLATDERLAMIVSGGASTSGRARGVEAATQRLVAAFDLVRNGQREVDDMFRLLVGGASPADGLDTARVELIGARALHDQSVADLQRADSQAIRATLARIVGDADVGVFEAAVDGQLTASAAGTADLSRLADVFRASFIRNDLYHDLLQVSADEATGLAHLRRVEAMTRMRAEIMAIGALVLVTAGAALGIAWTMTRRLRRLAARADQVSQGQLDGPAADERGPREVAVVARALNDTVANLRQLEGQAAALARGHLDDPLLATPVAGVLGGSIHASVQALSSAWREREELQLRLAHQANHDLLTALPNRKAALEGLERALARGNRHGEAVAVLFIDLDGFKRANDTYGHHVGDQILRRCAERLGENARGGDLLARLGGDEFVVVTERVASARESVELAGRLRAALTEPFDLGDLSIRLGASVGIGLSLDGRATALELLRDADHAVHRAKKLGKGRVEIFDEAARRELALHAELEHDLRRALEAGDLRLHYQPVTDTVTGAIHGFEALCRWTRDGVEVSPVEFIPVAEQSDLVNELGRWALAEAASQLVAWNRRGAHVGAYVAVNVSGRHLLSNGLLADVQQALDRSGLDPARLTIEITETVLVSDLVTAVSQLEAVRALGVRVALDDFGTGYTSIGQLWRLPVDVLKIDGSFIRHLETAHDHVIVELMIDVAHTLGLGLVAEGVETTAQLDTLRQLRCDAIQGYLVARPQAPEDLVPTTA